MNIERKPRVSKDHSSERVADVAWNFANTLTGGRWKFQNTRKVEVTRSVQERVSYARDIDDDFDPIYTDIMITFSAMKQLVSDDSGNDFLVPHYMIRSTTTQEVEPAEMPVNVIEEIIEEVKEKGHPLRQYLKEVHVKPKDVSVQNFQNFQIDRIQEVEYTVDYRGEIEDYNVSYSHEFDEISVHEVGYTKSNSEVLWYPMQYADGSQSENRPIILSVLNEESVTSEVRRFDSEYQEYLTNEALRELTAFGGMPVEEHRQRVLGIISLVSSGFVDLRKRARK